jgi:hypothetical protein
MIRSSHSLVVLLATLTLGCSASQPCTVTGTVLIKNTPTSGVYVVLHSADGQTAGTGRTGPDGVFRLTVAQPGEYPVTCFFPKVTKLREETIEGDDQFLGRYRDWNKPATKAVVKAGENTLPPIQLQ